MTMAEVRDTRFQLALEKVGIRKPNYATELNALLGRRQLAYLRLFDDARCLESLRRGVHVGIITNGAGDTHPDSQSTKIEHLGLSQRVDSIWISDAVGYRKPQARIFELACGTAGIAPQEAAFVGDSVSNDIVGANRAGMISILIDRAGQEFHHGDADGTPTYSVKSLLEVSSILNG
jgi:putative hydrolase of the HAD superfamily